MGMYNEVFCECPKCGAYSCLQVPQFVLGFGGFYLDQPETMLELDYEQLNELKGYIETRIFECEECGNCFSYWSGHNDDKLEYIKKLFE